MGWNPRAVVDEKVGDSERAMAPCPAADVVVRFQDVTASPARARCSAAASPLGPLPTTVAVDVTAWPPALPGPRTGDLPSDEGGGQAAVEDM